MRVLVVEDDPELAEMLLWCLELDDACTVDLYARISDVPDLADHEWDCALVDWMLPEQNGCHLARRLREVRPEMTVVVWTAAAYEAKRDPVCAGCTVLPKPSPIAAVRAALGLA